MVVDDCESWMPDETRGKVDRDVSRKVLAAVRGFDLVHAFGYRAAWACSAAFDRSFPWVYTAHELNKTRHPLFVESLNAARGGGASSEVCRHALEVIGVKNARTIVPGLPDNRRVLDRSECRAMLGVGDEEFLLVSAGRFCEEHCLVTPIQVVAALPHHVRLTICGKGELESELREAATERTVVTTEPFAQQNAIAAADLVVVPSTLAGFSFTAIEAMLQGTAVALRRIGGLTDLAVDHQSGFFFDSDEELLDLLNHLCFKRDLVREVGRAARERALTQFDIARTAQESAALYRDALGSKR